MGVAGSAAAASASICGSRFFRFGNFAFVERAVGAGFDLPRHVRAGRRHDDIVAGMAGQQFGFEHLVAVIDIVGDGDAGFLREIGDRVAARCNRTSCRRAAAAPRRRRSPAAARAPARMPRAATTGGSSAIACRAYNRRMLDCQRARRRPVGREGSGGCRFRVFCPPDIGGSKGEMRSNLKAAAAAILLVLLAACTASNPR